MQEKYNASLIEAKLFTVVSLSYSRPKRVKTGRNFIGCFIISKVFINCHLAVEICIRRTCLTRVLVRCCGLKNATPTYDLYHLADLNLEQITHPRCSKNEIQISDPITPKKRVLKRMGGGGRGWSESPVSLTLLTCFLYLWLLTPSFCRVAPKTQVI